MTDPVYRYDPQQRLHLFLWNDGEVVVPADQEPDRLGRIEWKVAPPGSPPDTWLGSDLGNPRAEADRWRLAQQAGRRDGVSPQEWVDRLLAVAEELKRRAPKLAGGNPYPNSVYRASTRRSFTSRGRS